MGGVGRRLAGAGWDGVDVVEADATGGEMIAGFWRYDAFGRAPIAQRIAPYVAVCCRMLP